jgi:hypothetical protein
VRAIDGELDTLAHDEPSVYREHADDRWDEVEASADRASSDLLARVGRPTSAAWLEGRSVASFIAGYAIRHPLGHLADYHVERGNDEEAQRVRAVAETILSQLPVEGAHPAVAR